MAHVCISSLRFGHLAKYWRSFRLKKYCKIRFELALFITYVFVDVKVLLTLVLWFCTSRCVISIVIVLVLTLHISPDLTSLVNSIESLEIAILASHCDLIYWLGFFDLFFRLINPIHCLLSYLVWLLNLLVDSLIINYPFLSLLDHSLADLLKLW